MRVIRFCVIWTLVSSLPPYHSAGARTKLVVLYGVVEHPGGPHTPANHHHSLPAHQSLRAAGGYDSPVLVGSSLVPNDTGWGSIHWDGEAEWCCVAHRTVLDPAHPLFQWGGYPSGEGASPSPCGVGVRQQGSFLFRWHPNYTSVTF